MNVYKVGGSVRDKLMGKTPHDIDYVVVGSSVEEMLSLGYKQVGKDFPVFLNENGDEYALARTERKTGNKHTDFEFVFDESITLEDDVLRRDFTCNALAEDEEGNIIDYVGGIKDINDKVLRIVREETFVEDSLRVLRLARFVAQLDFTVEPTTLELCKNMVKEGMLDHLTPERVFKEIEKALNTNKFHRFIETLDEIGALKVILPEIYNLKFVEEIESHHPEKTTYNHVILTLKRADKVYTTSPLEKFATLLHDVGKLETPSDVLPHHYGHEERGLNIIDSICKRLKVPSKYTYFAKLCCKYHMNIRRLYEMKPGHIFDIINDITNGFKDVEYPDSLFNVAEIDLFGRGKEPSFVRILQFKKCIEIYLDMVDILKDISAKDFNGLERYKGKEFGEMLRVKKIQYYLDKRKPS
jgi:tRNA nucleotidyltransferase (CCA-adding enzyme)